MRSVLGEYRLLGAGACASVRRADAVCGTEYFRALRGNKALGKDGRVRDVKWSEAIAVGTKAFVAHVKEALGTRARGRGVVQTGSTCELKETGIRSALQT